MKHYYKKFRLLLCLLFVLGFCTTSITAQTTITTNFTINNGFAIVTFNFTNNNASAVMVTGIGSVCSVAGSTSVAAYYKTSAISGAPGAINAGNGWNQFGSGSISATGGVIESFLTGLTLIVPAGATYGMCVEAKDGGGVGNLAYSTVAAGTYNFPGGGCVLTTGSNIGFAGDVAPNAPTFTPRGFIGSITFSSAVPCSGIPAPGNTLSTVNTACPTIPFTLSLQNATAGSGVTYQWQTSPDNIAAYVDVPTGGTNSTYVTTLAAPTYYRCKVTCSGNTTISTPKQVLLTPPSGCYCIPPNSDCTDDDVILNVKISTLDNASTCSPPSGYSNYTLTVPAPDVISGADNPMTVTVPTTYTEQVAVWIDYDHSGSFEASEFKLLGPNTGPGGGTITNNISIPATALLGVTRMRVRDRFATVLTGTQACLGYVYGETEDYNVNIVPCIQGVINTEPSDATIVCGGDASFSVDATGSLLNYRWEYRVSSSSPWINVPNAAPYSGVNSATLNITGATSSLNGYQYRVVIAGACTAIITSSNGLLTVDPLIGTVNPPAPVICNGSSQQLSITNSASAPVSVSFSSGPINVAIPEGTYPTGPYNAGASTIPVTIPAGAVITKIGVKMNITHAYVGDVVAVLKAANGNILNLDALLDQTNNPGANFVNTVISSTGTTLLSAGTAPFTAEFKPDAVGATFNPFGSDLPGGPIGYIPNVNTFSGLTTLPLTGNWTLAMYDAGAPDVGTLTSWSLDITYVAPTLATGIWGPITTPPTIYLDAALTIPYAGTPVTTVYVNPTVSTDYNVVVSTAICTSPPTIVPVTVNNPVAGVSRLTDVATCDGGNASFTVSATSGGIIDYQWQESTDGVTFSDITDGGVYSGSTTNTLDLTGVNTTYDGNQYRVILTVASCNSVTSDTALLTVNANPDFTIKADPAITQLYPGIKTTLSTTIAPATYQWYKNGVAVAGATAQSIEVDVDNLGDYTLSLVDSHGCSGTSTNTISVTAAPNDILFIYPSPNTGTFQVRYQSLENNILLPRTVSVFDSKGSRIYTKTYIINAPYGRMDVFMPNHAKGVYRVELSDRNGNRIKTGSVLIL